MALEIRWAPRASLHLEQICEYISQDSEVYAHIFAEKVLSVVEGIPSFPKAGRVVPEYDDENIRERIYDNYRIVYRLKEDVIEIVAICHGAHLLKNVLYKI